PTLRQAPRRRAVPQLAVGAGRATDDARLASGEWRNGRRAGLRSRCPVRGVSVRPRPRLPALPATARLAGSLRLHPISVEWASDPAKPSPHETGAIGGSPNLPLEQDANRWQPPEAATPSELHAMNGCQEIRTLGYARVSRCARMAGTPQARPVPRTRRLQTGFPILRRR